MFSHKSKMLVIGLISAVGTSLISIPSASAAACSSTDKKLVDKMVFQIAMASLDGGDEEVGKMLDLITKAKKTKSTNFRKALNKFENAIMAEGQSGTRWSYIPSIMKNWGTVQSIVKYKRC